MLKISNFPKNVAYLDSYVEFFFFGFLQTDHFGTCLKTSNSIILPYIDPNFCMKSPILIVNVVCKFSCSP